MLLSIILCSRNLEITWLGGLSLIFVILPRTVGIKDALPRWFLHSQIWYLYAHWLLCFSHTVSHPSGPLYLTQAFYSMVLSGRATYDVAYGFKGEGSRSSQGREDESLELAQCYFCGYFYLPKKSQDPPSSMKWRNKFYFLRGNVLESLQKSIWVSR